MYYEDWISNRIGVGIVGENRGLGKPDRIALACGYRL